MALNYPISWVQKGKKWATCFAIANFAWKFWVRDDANVLVPKSCSFMFFFSGVHPSHNYCSYRCLQFRCLLYTLLLQVSEFDKAQNWIEPDSPLMSFGPQPYFSIVLTGGSLWSFLRFQLEITFFLSAKDECFNKKIPDFANFHRFGAAASLRIPCSSVLCSGDVYWMLPELHHVCQQVTPGTNARSQCRLHLLLHVDKRKCR